MAKTARRLTDLYLVGEPLVIDDGSGDPIEVFIRKLNPVDHEKAMSRANSARSRAAANQRDPESDGYQEVMGTLLDFDKEALMAYLLEDARVSKQAVVEAERAADEEWSKDDYLAGLQQVDLETVDDEEKTRITTELDRFYKGVSDELDKRAEDLKADLELKDTEGLRKMVFDKLYEVHISMAWMTEFRRCEMWLATREPDKKTYYFRDRSEIDELPLEVFILLQSAYRNLSVDPLEGKDLGEPDISLD